MPQFLAEVKEQYFTLNKDEARHLGVLRFKQGAEVKLFDGLGEKYLGKLQDINSHSASGIIVSKLPACEPLVKIHLYFSVISRAAAEELLDVCTQLGVNSFTPVLSQYAEADFIKKRATKAERWQQIILSACKQSERATIPQIYEPLSFAQALKNNALPSIICYEDESKLNISSALLKLNNPKELAIFIGPEGGYSQQEIALAKSAGALAVSLGCNILRAQTAACAAVAKVLL